MKKYKTLKGNNSSLIFFRFEINSSIKYVDFCLYIPHPLENTGEVKWSNDLHLFMIRPYFKKYNSTQNLSNY